MQVSRRKFAAVSIGLVSSGGIGAALTNSDSYSASAASVSGKFQTPEVNKELTSDVSSLTLTVTGTAAWQADSDPSKAYIRLRAAPKGGSMEQLDSHVFGALARDFEGDFSFHDLSLFEHSEISQADVTPGEVGASKTLTLVAELELVVKRDGRELASDTLSESVPVRVERVVGGAEVQLGAQGEIAINEGSSN